MAVELPQWLERLRSCVIVDRVNNDSRSVGGTFFGVNRETAQREVLGRGQANFDEPWRDLTPEDRVLVYAYLNQKGHLEELVEAFCQMFPDGNTLSDPIIIDLGSGPCTGGLAFASIQSDKPKFEYIGVDQSCSMRKFGKTLCSNTSQMAKVQRQWSTDIPSISWQATPGWRPVIVIVSYLLASPTLNPAELVGQLECLLRKIGNGPVTVLYTNSSQSKDNRRFPEFRDSLTSIGCRLYADDLGAIEVSRGIRTQERPLRYALFHRPKQQTLKLGG